MRERGFGHALQFIAGHDAPLRRESFAVSKLDLCRKRLRTEEFAEQVCTDRLTVAQTAERIAASAGLVLRPNTDSALRGRLRRTGIGIRHTCCG